MIRSLMVCAAIAFCACGKAEMVTQERVHQLGAVQQAVLRRQWLDAGGLVLEHAHVQLKPRSRSEWPLDAAWAVLRGPPFA